MQRSTFVHKDGRLLRGTAIAHNLRATIPVSERQRLLPLTRVLENARAAKAKGASRFCMGAAWRGPKDSDLEPVLEMVREVKKLGLEETCVTLGMLQGRAGRKTQGCRPGLLQSQHRHCARHYGKVITTHPAGIASIPRQGSECRRKSAAEELSAWVKVQKSRAALVAELANMTPPPDSVPINNLVAIEGTPLADVEGYSSRFRSYHRRRPDPPCRRAMFASRPDVSR